MKLLIIDNYDSFTYNLVQYLGELGAEVTVIEFLGGIGGAGIDEEVACVTPFSH